MLDLCSGLGGASAAMKDRGWEVITLDVNPDFNPDIIADLNTWSYNGPTPDLVWISIPCTEFSRESMPWCRTGEKPDLALYHSAMRIVREIPDTIWVLENVRGAIRYFGKPKQIIGPFCLWGNFPPIISKCKMKRKIDAKGSGAKRAAERAKIPYPISESLAIIIESQLKLF